MSVWGFISEDLKKMPLSNSEKILVPKSYHIAIAKLTTAYQSYQLVLTFSMLFKLYTSFKTISKTFPIQQSFANKTSSH